MTFGVLLACHMLAFLLGFVADLVVGDPRWFPHPVRAIGKLISALEGRLNTSGKTPAQLRRSGTLLVVVVVAATVAVVACVLAVAYAANIWAGIVVEAALTCMLLSTKDLRKQSMLVQRHLVAGDLEGARHAVSMIVGRDTNVLDGTGVAKAAIETVAENAADGVIAPMICAAIGGPVLGFAYKAINTMDSMVAYKNERFLHFGRTAAKLDDVVNFLPARISAYLMMAASALLAPIGGSLPGRKPDTMVKVFSASRAHAVFKRDRFKHKSPNSAQTESTCAGSLGVQLAGNISYFGVMNEKPTIGDDLRPVQSADILRANQLMYGTAILCEIACLTCLLVVAISTGTLAV